MILIITYSTLQGSNFEFIMFILPTLIHGGISISSSSESVIPVYYSIIIILYFKPRHELPVSSFFNYLFIYYKIALQAPVALTLSMTARCKFDCV